MNHDYDEIMGTLLSDCEALPRMGVAELKPKLIDLVSKGIACFEDFYYVKENAQPILASYEANSTEGRKMITAKPLKPSISKYIEYADGMTKFVSDIFALSSETAGEVNESVESNLEKALCADGQFVDSIFEAGDTKIKACTMSDNFSDAITAVDHMVVVKEFLENSVDGDAEGELGCWRAKAIRLLVTSILHFERNVFNVISNQLKEITETTEVEKSPEYKLIYKTI